MKKNFLSTNDDNQPVTIKVFRAKFDGLTNNVGGLTKRVDGLTETVGGLTKNVSGLANRIEKLEKKVDKLDEKNDLMRDEFLGHFDKLYHELLAIRQEMTIVSHQRTENDEVLGYHEKRIFALETRFAAF
mgnify:CR=1 FL=1